MHVAVATNISVWAVYRSAVITALISLIQDSASFVLFCLHSMSQLRIDRALSQKMYLLYFGIGNVMYHGHPDVGFVVSGSVGVKYRIIIGTRGMSCTCPDFKLNSSICKHIYFIFGKIMKYDISTLRGLCENMNIYQYFSDFLETLQSHLKQKVTRDLNVQNVRNNEYCVICFEEFQFTEGSSAIYEKCQHCQNIFHKECIVRWRMNKNTCPLCNTTYTSTHDPLEFFKST